MSNLSGLIEYVHPIDPTSLCGTVLDRILDMPGCDLLAVVKQGRPVGVIARGAVRPQNAGLRVSEVMTPALTVGAEMSVDEPAWSWSNAAATVAWSRPARSCGGTATTTAPRP